MADPQDTSSDPAAPLVYELYAEHCPRCQRPCSNYDDETNTFVCTHCGNTWTATPRARRR